MKKEYYLSKSYLKSVVMLGMNVKKELVKGEFAKAVRKAALESLACKKTHSEEYQIKPKERKYKFEWK